LFNQGRYPLLSSDSTKEYLLFIVLIMLGLFLRMIFHPGLVFPDSLHYSQVAFNKITNLLSRPADPVFQIFYARGLVWLPLAINYRLFGVNVFSGLFWQLIWSLGNLIMIYCLANIIFRDKRVTIFSLFLLAFFPLDLSFLIQITPDAGLAFLLASAVYVFLTNQQSNQKTGLYFLAGLLMGLCIFIRETGVFMMLSFLVIYFCIKRNLRIRHGFILLGCLTILASYCLFTLFAYGDFLLRLKEILETNRELRLGKFGEYSKDYSNFFFYLLPFLGLSKAGLANLGFFYPAALVSIIYCYIKKKIKNILIPLLWLVSFLIILVLFGVADKLGSVSNMEYRYTSVVTMPIILIIAFSAMDWLHSARRDRGVFINSMGFKKTILFLSIIFLSSTSLYGAYRLRKIFLIDATPFKEVASFLQTQPRKNTFFTHPWWPLYINYYFKYQTNFDYYAPQEANKDSFLKYLSEKDGLADIRDAYIIYDRRFIYPLGIKSKPLIGKKRKDLPEFIYHIPVEWKAVFKSGAVTVYQTPTK